MNRKREKIMESLFNFQSFIRLIEFIATVLFGLIIHRAGYTAGQKDAVNIITNYANFLKQVNGDPEAKKPDVNPTGWGTPIKSTHKIIIEKKKGN